MAERQKKERSRGLMIGLAVFLLWAIGAVIVVVMVALRPPDLSESPVASRDNPTFDDASRVGLLKPMSLAPKSGHPAPVPFVKPVRIDGSDSNFVLHWQGEEVADEETLPERMATTLLGDENIELFAFATWMPGADDKIEVVKEFDPDRDRTSATVTNADSTAPLTFRDPTTLEVFSAEQLDQLNIPKSFHTAVAPEKYKTGIIRLLFRSQNMDPVHFVGGSGGDLVTGAKVTYSLDALENEPDQASSGEWTHYDFALLLWHDKALKFHVQVLTGEPIYADLPQEPGEQVVFGEALRVQWLAREAGVFDNRFTDSFTPGPDVDHKVLKGIASLTDESASIISRDEFPGTAAALASPANVAPSTSPEAKTGAESEGDDDEIPLEFQVESDLATHIGSRVSTSSATNPETFFRVSNEEYLDHLGRIADDGSITWDFSGESDKEQIQFASCKHTKVPTDPLRLVFLPHLTELTFEIAGTPDLPNPRNIEDLFDQEIPRLTLSGSTPSGAEGELIEFVAVATQTAVEHSDLWDEGWPSSMPIDHSFRNTTPQQIMNWYLETSPQAFVEQDTDLHLLLVNQDEETFWTKLMDFLLGF